MLYTEQQAKANIRNRDGKRVFYLGKGDQLTPGARDWLSRERIEILPGEAAKPERFKLLSGGFAEEKPEHMTHLNGDTLVHKTHPRIAFRGAMDAMEAELMLCGLVLQEPMKKQLQEVLEYTRYLLRCEVLEEKIERDTLCGLTQDQLRSHSHRPQDFYGQPHFMPEVTDGEAILRLNRCRCASREAELKAVAAFSDREGNPTRIDLLRAMNRLSSMIYILMVKQKSQNGRN